MSHVPSMYQVCTKCIANKPEMRVLGTRFKQRGYEIAILGTH